MKLARSSIFILYVVCVCIMVVLYSCKTTKKSSTPPQREAENGQTALITEQNSIKKLQLYRAWQNQYVSRIEPVIPNHFNSDALYARTDSTLSAFIPAGNLFKPNSSTPLKAPALSLFDCLTRLLSEHPELSLCIAGHEANDDNEVYNLHLSTKRAKNLVSIFEENRKKTTQTGICTPPRFSGYGSSYLNKLDDFPQKALIEFRLTPCK